MRRPCWQFLQAGHSLTSSMRHPLHPIHRLLSALDTGPGVAGPEHLREIVDAIEVLLLVACLARQQTDLDQREDNPSEVLRARDAPVREDGRRQEAELLLGKVAARPRELSAAQVAAGGELPLRVLERRQHEQVPALVVTAVLLADSLEGLFQCGEIAHGRASVCPDERGRTGRGRDWRASSGIPSATARARSRLHAAWADSFITSPSCPVRVICPLPGIWIASMNMMSPPTGVHARPVATPTSGLRPATSLWTLGRPANFSRFFAVILTVAARPSTTSSAALRSTPWISRSSWRTPASRVNSAMSRSSALSATAAFSPASPVSLSCRGSR